MSCTDRIRTSWTMLAAALSMTFAGSALASGETASSSLSDAANDQLQLRWSDIETIDIRGGDGDELLVKLAIDGIDRSIVLAPSSIRTADYRVLEDRGNGALVEITPGPVNTYRGTVSGMDRSIVSGSYMNDLLYLTIRFDDGSRWWAEPLADRIKDAGEDQYAVYPQAAIISPKGFCGTNEFEHGILDDWEFAKINDGESSRGSSVCTAVLACDADYEYYQDYGSSTSAVEDRINSVINSVNAQYESQVGLTMSITTIIVRTTSSDPYSGSIDNRLEQVRSHWNSSQGGINRDLVQLFTGNGGGGGTIGIAWLSAVCTSYAYSVVESDCCGSFGCATDLSAHEFGHNWGAGHCDCTSNTMNPYIVCANNFSAQSIGSITSYRDSISSCLDGQCGDGGGGGSVENDECADAIFISEGSTAFTTVGGTTSSDAYDDAQCSGTYLGEMNDDVWFAWTATASGTITVGTCDLIDFDSDMVLYEGNCNNKTQIGCNGDTDGCGGYSSQITADVSGGNLYLVRVGGWDGSATGSGSISLSLEPSGDPVGGCCTGAVCSISTQADCGGTYLGDGSDCGGDPCAPTGACCTGTSCSITTQADCGGTYIGDGTGCNNDPCAPDPTGACCTGTTCSITTQADCGGTYLGDDTDCNGNPCADPTGACCIGTSCTVTTAADCSGTYQGDGTNCNGDPCGGGGGGDAFEGLAYSIVGKDLVDDAEPTWTVDVYAVLGDGCRLDAVAGDSSTSKMVSTTSSFYQNIYGGNTSAAINPALFPAFPDLRYDSFMTIGLLDQTDNNLSDIGIDFGAFEAGGAIDASDGSWFVTPDDVQGQSGTFSNQSCEAGNGVRIARLTVRDLSASVFVEALFQGKDASGATWQASGSVSIVYDDCNSICDGDFDGSGTVDVSDLLLVIANWDDPYNVSDLLLVIADWNCGAP